MAVGRGEREGEHNGLFTINQRSTSDRTGRAAQMETGRFGMLHRATNANSRLTAVPRLTIRPRTSRRQTPGEPRLNRFTRKTRKSNRDERLGTARHTQRPARASIRNASIQKPASSHSDAGIREFEVEKWRKAKAEGREVLTRRFSGEGGRRRGRASGGGRRRRDDRASPRRRCSWACALSPSPSRERLSEGTRGRAGVRPARVL